MGAISRYILRQLLATVVGVTLILTAAVWLSQSLRMISMIVNEGPEHRGVPLLHVAAAADLLRDGAAGRRRDRGDDDLQPADRRQRAHDHARGRARTVGALGAGFRRRGAGGRDRLRDVDVGPARRRCASSARCSAT
jgi:hypothetical protein